MVINTWKAVRIGYGNMHPRRKGFGNRWNDTIEPRTVALIETDPAELAAISPIENGKAARITTKRQRRQTNMNNDGDTMERKATPIQKLRRTISRRRRQETVSSNTLGDCLIAPEH